MFDPNSYSQSVSRVTYGGRHSICCCCTKGVLNTPTVPQSVIADQKLTSNLRRHEISTANFLPKEWDRCPQRSPKVPGQLLPLAFTRAPYFFLIPPTFWIFSAQTFLLHIYVHVRTHMCEISPEMYVFVCIFTVFVCMCICVYICVYVWFFAVFSCIHTYIGILHKYTDISVIFHSFRCLIIRPPSVF